jgi:hypothetical protein
MATIVLRKRTNVIYLGDKILNQVHYLPNERDQCQIDNIIESGNSVAFFPDTLEEARKTGWIHCPFCLGSIADGSVRRADSDM